MIEINKDYFNNIVPPDYILCKANRERIGILKCTEKTLDVKFNDINEISFKINLYIDENIKNPYYEAVDVMKYILLPHIGFFCISSVDVESEGTKEEFKTVNAKEYQCLLAQRYLELFAVNTGADSANNDVQFYNMMDKKKSLLHLALEKFPQWSIGHVDPALVSQQRTFEEIAQQDVYSFLTTNVAEAFQCVLIFNTLNNTINAYEEKTLGLDTGLHVSYNNLLKNTSVSCSTDDIKTCLTVYGQDDMDISAINMGIGEIYNFDYYNSTDFWSEGLYKAYNKWIALRASKLEEYNSLQEQDEQYIVQIDYLTYEMMPETIEDEGNWTKYGLVPLQEQLEIYRQKQNLSKNAGHGDVSSEYYLSEYVPIHNTIRAISYQSYVRQNQINLLQVPKLEVENKKDEIATLVSMENNFTKDQLKELYSFIREDELTSDNFLITDTMSEAKKIEWRHKLLEYGEEELAKVSVPQLTFKVDMANLFAIPEFNDFIGNFDVGNYIWVSLRDDYSVKTRLTSIHINFYDLTDFTVEFGNICKTKNGYTDITEAIRLAQSTATSVSFNSSNWNDANKTSKAIDQMIADGLINSGARLKSANSEVEIDSRGIFVNTTRDGYVNDAIYIGDSQILFTQDNWLTVEEAIGRVDINGESVFGVIAKAVLAGNIISSTITGGNMYGTTITVGGKNNESGILTVFDENENPLVTLDKRGITLAENVNISWNNISDTDDVAYTSDIPTDEYITTITSNAITCENIKGNIFNGKRFIGDNVGMNSCQSDGWAIYAGGLLEAVEPYTDQHIFNIGHGGELYAQTGTFKYLRMEDRCANSNAYMDFIYSRGSSNAIHTGTIYQDASAFRINSDYNIELNATEGEGKNIKIYGQTIILGGTVNVDYSIIHKQSADFYYQNIHKGALFADVNGMSIESRNNTNLSLNSASGIIKCYGILEQTQSNFYYNDSHFGTLSADEWGMVIKSPSGEINFYAPDNGNGRCHFNLEVEMRSTVYDASGSSVISSDRNLKNSIESLNVEKSAEFIYSLVPCKFKYNVGTSNRYHHGLIAQDVKDSMEKFTGEDWGLYVEYLSNGELRRGLRNEELIADLIATIQTQNERIKILEKK